MAQAKLLKTMTSWYQPLIDESGYPNIKLRLSEILKQLLIEDYPGNPLVFLRKHGGANLEVRDALTQYFELWKKHLENQPVQKRTISVYFEEELVEPFYALVDEALGPRTLEILSRIAQRVIPNDRCPTLTDDLFARISRLEHDLPPSVAKENINSFAEIMSAAWAYQVIYGEERENKAAQEGNRYDEHSKTCRLMLKAIELIPVYQSIEAAAVDEARPGEAPAPAEGFLNKRGVLNAAEIRRRATLDIKDASHIHIAPLRLEAINGASLDVHLGNWFSYARRTKLRSIKPRDENDEKLLKLIGQREAFIPLEKTFLLHPGDLALGVTQEFIALPKDVMAFVEGLSGLGRLGLFVATATQVAPTFHGVIVLELANAGTVPLELRPGIKIGQLVFQTMIDPVDKLYRGKYYCQIKPLT